MNLHLTRRAAALCWLFAAVFMAGEATGHGGLSMEKDYCKLRIGAYVMHFTGYPPGDGYRNEFCEDIPSIGATIVVLGFIDDVLRDLPVAVRILHDDGSGHDFESATVYHVPPKIYPMGTLSFDYQFEQPGKYVGLATAGDGNQQVIGRFPFSVGAPFCLRSRRTRVSF
jgi:hypothetical protein